MKILTSLDLIKNELQNAVIQNLAADPANPKEGQIYYNTTDHTLRQYKNTGWAPVGTEYTLPIASAATLGGIKVGAGLQISDQGTLSVTGGGVAESVEWSGVLDKPTTIAGYGIVDAKIDAGVITLGTATITPVVSVNGKTGSTLVLSAADVGALADDTTYVSSVNSKTGAVTLTKTDVGLDKVANVLQYSADNEPPYPVTSVDGETGAVVLNDVKYTAQTLSEAQKTQARTNIGAGTSSFSGSYNDLTDKPAIDTAMSASSTNAVQNKVIKAYVDGIVAASQGVVYKGTISAVGDIPTTYEVGWLYMVATAGTYVGQVCEVGDLLIAVVARQGTGNQNSDWDCIQTNINGAITEITGDEPISVTGTGASREVALNNSGVTTGGYGDTAAQAPAFGGAFKVPSFTVDQYGRLTVAGEHNVTIPSAVASDTANGLMAKADYTLLHGVDTRLTTAEGEIDTLQANMVTRGSATIPAGDKTVSATIPAGKIVTAVLFKNATTGEAVICDWTHSGATLTASITTAVTYDVNVIYTYM